ncbi:MAG: LamG domain-containing protein [Candidatus Poribacteria bacterium]|jgi:hypothetical protein|nr:LamG domain-containing protein [Candidatus Poribacteria bacterium]
MNQFFVLCFFVLLIFGLGDGVWMPTAQGDEFMGAWLLNDGGKVMKDFSGQDRHGEITLGPDAKWINGPYGKPRSALLLDDQSFCRVKDPGGIFDTPEGITVGCWTIISGLPDCCSGIPRKMDSADAGGWVLHPSAEGGGWKLHFWAHAGGWVGTGAADILPMSAPNPGKWTPKDWVHTAATYDGSVVRVFVNGVKKGEKKGEVNEIDPGDGALGWSHDVFKRRHQGAISETFIYDEAMSEAEIKAIVKNGLGETLAVRSRGKLPTAWGILKKRY